MPTYRSITTSCVSQHGIRTLPEYKPPIKPNDPFQNVPQLLSDDNSAVSVYLPTYPGSQFWLCYSISPPYPPKVLYYFKLFIDGKMIVSWGCGEEEGYQGKTMFGLFSQSPTSLEQPPVERRMFLFGPDREHKDNLALDSQKDVMEIRVFRSKGRTRIAPELQDYRSPSGDDNRMSQQHSGHSGLNLVNGGCLSVRDPRRYYRYALLDPLDQPFATFRYYCRSYDHLESLGVISPSASYESSSIDSDSRFQEQLSRRSSDNTMNSFATVAASMDANPSTSTETIMRHANNDISHSLPAAYENIRTSTLQTVDTAESEEEDSSSPFRATIIKPFTLPRPGTPPPSATPFKPPQLPSTDTNFPTLGSKESFASLIRSHIPSPDPSAYHLHELVAEPRPATPLRSRSTSVGLLNNVLSSARRRRSGEESRSEDNQVFELEGSGIATKDARSSPPANKAVMLETNRSHPDNPNQSNYSLIPTNPPLNSKSSRDYLIPTPSPSPIASAELTPTHLKPTELNHLRRRVQAEYQKEDRRRDSLGSGNSGSQEGEKKGKKKGRKRVHLWEQL